MELPGARRHSLWRSPGAHRHVQETLRRRLPVAVERPVRGALCDGQLLAGPVEHAGRLRDRDHAAGHHGWLAVGFHVHLPWRSPLDSHRVRGALVEGPSRRAQVGGERGCGGVQCGGRRVGFHRRDRPREEAGVRRSRPEEVGRYLLWRRRRVLAGAADAGVAQPSAHLPWRRHYSHLSGRGPGPGQGCRCYRQNGALRRRRVFDLRSLHVGGGVDVVRRHDR
mmetsp:Transcript_81109/g.225658  ORF Transcript_81109/g.225658 Transcript_81109/m.225658 type:complete len:223 (-) Transcript_81109:586-1254(-)